MHAAVVEFEPGPDHEVAQRAGDKHVVPSGQSGYASADVHGDAADVVAADLALAGVQPGADFNAQRLYGIANCHGAADCSLRTVERREEAVSRCVDFAAVEAREL